MSHIPYTIYRAGKYYYNRRVPSHAVKTYGPFIRYFLTKDRKKVEPLVNRVKSILATSWRSENNKVPVNIPSLNYNFEPRPNYLSQAAESICP